MSVVSSGRRPATDPAGRLMPTITTWFWHCPGPDCQLYRWQEYATEAERDAAAAAHHATHPNLVAPVVWSTIAMQLPDHL